MTQQRRIDEAITEWLEDEAPDRIPDWALRAAIERARVARRQRALPGWRWYTMPRFLPLAAGLAATVIAILVIGPWIQGPRPGVGGQPTAASTPSASPQPASPTPRPTASSQAFEGVRPYEGIVGALDPGTYSISSIEPLEIRFTVPFGWEVPPGAPEFRGPTGRNGREIGGLSFWEPDLLEIDPCRSDPRFHLELPLDATADEVMGGIAAEWETAISAPEDTMLGGFEGRFATVTAPCGAAARYWVLDVAGQTIVVIAHVWAESSAAQAAELQGIVDSVEIDAP